MTDFLSKLKRWTQPWREISNVSKLETLGPLKDDLPKAQEAVVLEHMNACLMQKGGDVSARARAAELGQAYLELNAQGKIKFLKLLTENFTSDKQAVDKAIEDLKAASEPLARETAESNLRKALTPKRTELLRQFNALPQGVKFLVDLRSDLLQASREDATLSPLERDLKDVLISWFDVGFLELQRLTWQSPASVLEKIAEYEAVHSIQSWNDLKNRLARDRRLFAFFHPRMPEEPLIFVEVALVNGIADNVQDLLDEEAPLLDPQKADTAIFYSISNAQSGLAGISFGNFLIKKCVDLLSKDLPNLKAFSTLSPIPGFRKWLEETMAMGDADLLLPAERELLKSVSGKKGAKGSFKALLESEDWRQRPEAIEAVKGPLMRLCARYLSEAKRKGIRAKDPVAHFHLSNGARMERINWMGDSSKKGLDQSYGLMINYLYKLSDIERNHEAYSETGKIAMSSQMKALQKS